MEEQVQQAVIKSTPEGMKRFMEGSVWEDLLNEMKVWDAMLLRRYDSCESVEDLRWLQGAREAISYCMQLPERIMEGLEQDQRDKDEEEEERQYATMDKI